MDGHRFDDLTKALAGGVSRRGLLRLLGGAAAGAGAGLLGRGAGAAPGPKKCKYQGGSCKLNADCCTLNCCNRVCCGDGQSCVNGQCVRACQPTTCAAQGATCGSIPHGCGGTLDCGPCECAGQPDGTACGTGGACDDGRCFKTFGNCGGCGVGAFGVPPGGGATFCTSDTADTWCDGQACAQTADCPEGQWCDVLPTCGGNSCVHGCPA